jgi:ethanolamine utilization protein EutN
MLIARVRGSVVSTVKDPSLTGSKLLLVQAANETGESNGPLFVAVDGVGAGTGELVLVVTGSAARHGQRSDGQSSDALVVGILDSMDVDGVVSFRKS